MRRMFEIFLGIVFLAAALFRILFPAIMETEAAQLGLPVWFGIVVIILELCFAGLLFWGKYPTYVLWIAVAVVGIAIIVAVAPRIFMDWSELFIFDPTPTDIMLHVTYLFILIALLVGQLRETKRS